MKQIIRALVSHPHPIEEHDAHADVPRHRALTRLLAECQ